MDCRGGGWRKEGGREWESVQKGEEPAGREIGRVDAARVADFLEIEALAHNTQRIALQLPPAKPVQTIIKLNNNPKLPHRVVLPLNRKIHLLLQTLLNPAFFLLLLLFLLLVLVLPNPLNSPNNLPNILTPRQPRRAPNRNLPRQPNALHNLFGLQAEPLHNTFQYNH